MSKTVRTYGDYTIKAGGGSSGSDRIILDASEIRVPGSLTVEGTQTTLNSATLTIEDKFIEVNRNNSTAGTEDGGIFFNQGSNNHQIFYYDADQSEFVVGVTTQDSDATSITNITPGYLRIKDPSLAGGQPDHAATRSYVDAQIAGGGFSIGFTGDDSTTVSVTTGNTVDIAGGSNISTAAAEPDTITVNLNQVLTDITSITATGANGDLTLVTNGSGDVVVNDTLTFSGTASTPPATAITKIYNKTAGGGGTGLFFLNSNINSGSEGELISKSKATALAIALG